MFQLVIILAAGILLLWKGAEALVQSSSSLARWFGVSSLIVGLTVAALGTSLPELIVSVLAALQGSPNLAIGNILGSNIANILLVLGIAASITPLVVQRSTVWKEIPFSLLAVFVFGVQANDVFFGDGPVNSIGRGNALVLLGIFVVYVYYIFGLTHETRAIKDKIDEYRKGFQARRHPVLYFLGKILIGLLFLAVGGQAVVYGGAGIARFFGVSEIFIGLTLVAVGTSLPELATTTVAAFRGEVDIAVGNIVGSNILNILLILGTTAIIRPLGFTAELNTDLLFVVVATILLFGAILLFGKRLTITRVSGVGFLALYIIYIFYVGIREFGAA